MSQTYPYPWTVCHRHIPVKNVVRHFLKHEGLGISKNENEFTTWVSLGIFLLWSVNRSFHKRNENDFFTWVSLGIFLLWSVNHSFHKRNENDFSTLFSLGILLFYSFYHSFHKINQNWKKIITTPQICLPSMFWHYFGKLLLQKLDFIFKVLSTEITRKWDPKCYNLLW